LSVILHGTFILDEPQVLTAHVLWSLHLFVALWLRAYQCEYTLLYLLFIDTIGMLVATRMHAKDHDSRQG